jgi:NAD(P)-dependent dehydrogenase (short-subunit alcohol dehydrogenase family)
LILVFGGLTGGLGEPLHKDLCALYSDQVVMAIGRTNCNVESEDSIAAFLKLLSVANPLHIINATGFSVSAVIHKTDVADIHKIFRVNVTANILLLKHARELYKVHGGTFTMLSSVTASDGPVGTAAYAASKAALHGLVRVAAKEFAMFKTRVNCLELGYFNRGMISEVPSTRLQNLIEGIPLEDLGTVNALAHACKFLIDCEYVTGAIVKVNGGL